MEKRRPNNLSRMINSSTPFSPKNDEEIRASRSAGKSRGFSEDAEGAAGDSQNHAVRFSVRDAAERKPARESDRRSASIRVEDDRIEKELSKFLDALDFERQNALSMLDEQLQARFVAKDREGFVAVTVNGIGQVVEIEFAEESLAQYRSLGKCLCSVLDDARDIADHASGRLQEERLPGMRPMAELMSGMERPGKDDFDQYRYSPKLFNTLLEHHEAGLKIRRVRQEMEMAICRVEIRHGAGYIEMSAAGTRLCVEFSGRASRMDRSELSIEVLRAIEEVSRSAQKKRYEFLNSVVLDGVRLGDEIERMVREHGK